MAGSNTDPIFVERVCTRAASVRPSVRGKFLFASHDKFHIRGLTYGTFSPNDNGTHFPPRRVMRSDFIETTLRDNRTRAARGGNFHSWDLEVRGGLAGGTRITMSVEEHGEGRQLARFRVQPALAPSAVTLLFIFQSFGFRASTSVIEAAKHIETN